MSTLAFLRRVLQADVVNSLWQSVRGAPVESGVDCPFCRNGMKTAVHLVPEGKGGEIELDVCTTCHAVWFDTHELETLGWHHARPPEPSESSESGLSPRAREILAMARIEAIRREAEGGNDLNELHGVPPDKGWKAVITLFGIPVKEEAPPIYRWPFVTWAAVLFMVLAMLWLWNDGPAVIRDWGLLPADPMRSGGLTFLTSFFIHAGVLHLLVNAVFLLMFGDNAEDCLGHGKFLLLLAGSAITGDLVHFWLEPRADMPLVGASGGISGVIAFYALQFPHVKLVMAVRIFPLHLSLFRWVRFSAGMGFIMWLVLQFAGIYMQMGGLSLISSLAHVGGAAFGVAFWAVIAAKERWGSNERSLS